jgi:hypothetical protein
VYEQIYGSFVPDAPSGWRLALEVGIAHEREFIRFWSKLAGRRSSAKTPARS